MEFTIHPEVPATDIQRARTWYKEKLGLNRDAIVPLLLIPVTGQR